MFCPTDHQYADQVGQPRQIVIFQIRGQSTSSKLTKAFPHGAEGWGGSIAWRRVSCLRRGHFAGSRGGPAAGPTEVGAPLEARVAICGWNHSANKNSPSPREPPRPPRPPRLCVSFWPIRWRNGRCGSASGAADRCFPPPFMHDVSPPFAQFRLANTPDWVILRVLR